MRIFKRIARASKGLQEAFLLNRERERERESKGIRKCWRLLLISCVRRRKKEKKAGCVGRRCDTIGLFSFLFFSPLFLSTPNWEKDPVSQTTLWVFSQKASEAEFQKKFE